MSLKYEPASEPLKNSSPEAEAGPSGPWSEVPVHQLCKVSLSLSHQKACPWIDSAALFAHARTLVARVSGSARALETHIDIVRE